jgi:hypothetical protein
MIASICFVFLGCIAAFTSADDVCISSGKRVQGNSNCSSGEIQLNATYINLGINIVGSFGTNNSFLSSYYSGQLGIIADYDMKGFNSSLKPAYAFSGDFVVSSKVSNSALEGWIVRYTLNSKATTIVCEGLVSQYGMYPKRFMITSDDETVSAHWVGSDGNIELRKVYYIDRKSLRITSSVTIKNIASSTISNFYCK